MYTQALLKETKENGTSIELSEISTVPAISAYTLRASIDLLKSALSIGQKNLVSASKNRKRVSNLLIFVALGLLAADIWQTFFVPGQNQAAGLDKFNNDFNPTLNGTCYATYPMNTTSQFCDLQRFNSTILSDCLDLGEQACSGNMNYMLVAIFGGVSMLLTIIWAGLKSTEENPNDVVRLGNTTATPFSSLSNAEQARIKKTILHHNMTLYTGSDVTLEELLSAFEKQMKKPNRHVHFQTDTAITVTQENIIEDEESDEKLVKFHGNTGRK